MDAEQWSNVTGSSCSSFAASQNNKYSTRLQPTAGSEAAAAAAHVPFLQIAGDITL